MIVNVEKNSKKNSFVSVIFVNDQETFGKRSSELLEKLVNILRALEKDKIRVVILNLTGRQKYLPNKSVWEFSKCEEDVLYSIANSNLPIIASLKGVAVGLVFRLVMSSHICIAANSAILFSPRISHAHYYSKHKEETNSTPAKSEKAVVDKEISSEKAVKLGIINKIVLEEELEEASFELAERISNLAPLAIRACLEATNRGLKLPLIKGLEIENQLFVSLFNTEDMREGVAAFLGKRKPKFEGK